MPESIFVTAAAKLLEQHTKWSRGLPAGRPAPPKPAAAPPPRPQDPEIEKFWQSAPAAAEQPAAPIVPVAGSRAVEGTPGSPGRSDGRRRSSGFTKVLLILAPAALGCAAMVLLFPPTSYGIEGNLAIGLIGGGLLGAVIAGEL